MPLTELLQKKLKLTYDQVKGLTIEEFQERLAPGLRALVSQALNDENHQMTSKIKRENLTVNDNGRTFEEFKKKQKESGNWGEYPEAIILAYELEFNLRVNEVKDGQSQFKYQELFTKVKDAPLIQLDNLSDDGHWEYKGETTAGGNCLYNAFAKAIFEIVHAENQNDKKLHEVLATKLNSTKLTDQKSKTSLGNTSTLFSAKKIIAHQKSIEAQIPQSSKIVKKEEMKKPANTHKSSLSKVEEISRQRQIHQDYLFALELAAEELERSSIKSKL